jgi:hypothetical protein
LRDSYLTITNELSQYTRKNQILEDKILEITLKLKKEKQENLNLQTEVGAMQVVGFSTTTANNNSNTNNNNNNSPNNINNNGNVGAGTTTIGLNNTNTSQTIPTTTTTNNNITNTSHTHKTSHHFKNKNTHKTTDLNNILDQKLQKLLFQRNISTDDALLILRRIVGHLTHSPFISSISDVAKLLTAPTVLQIFDVEAITVFITPFVEMPSSQLFYKFSSETCSSLATATGMSYMHM